MTLRGTKVAVTGADGFIGSHLVEALVENGASVRALACYNSFSSRGWLDVLGAETSARIEVRSGDVRDRSFVERFVDGCEVVFHLAALIGIPYSYEAPESYLETNVRGTINVLEAARRTGARVIHTSTSEVYGTAQTVPISELHPLNAQSPYAASKIAADQFALSYYRSFGTKVVVVRPFNTYGPRQSVRAVIPTIIMQLASGRRELALGSTTPTRDFSFVEDTARGFVAAASAGDRPLGEVVNLGSGFEVSIEETARTIGEVMGVEISFRTEERRVRPAASEVERLFADHRKALDLLSWKPEFGGRDGFRKGLERTVGWFTEPANLLRYRADDYGR
jgi:NAD dependent epimerase/dehydratase